ncbi:uncharacterized protein ISCGN_013380, partial [Ixodes scapularis]
MGLLCRHFLAVCVKFDLKPSFEKAVHKRWFMSCQLEFLGNSVKSNPEASSSEEPRILSMPGSSFEKMNRNQKFNYAMRTLRAVADNLADCQPDVFATRLALLESLNASWLRREDVTSRVSHEDVEVAENVATQDVRPAIVSKINQQEETDQEQVNVATGCASSRSNVTVPDSDTPSSASQGCTVTYQFKLPEVKSRGRPSKRVLHNRLKRARELDEDGPVPFKHLSEKAKAK